MIEKIIQKYGTDLDTVFVFPSRIASRLWFQNSLRITGLKTVPAENYISWDVFKANCLVSESGGLKPVSNTIRNIFAEYILVKNSEAHKKGAPLFLKIVPEAYARTGDVFSKWILRILPQLDHFEKRYKEAGYKFETNIEMQDFLVLKEHYAAFLKENALFEPSWISSKVYMHNKKYVIIYPELMEDFSEHAKLLQTQKDIIFINCKPLAENTDADLYASSVTELRNTVLQIEKLFLKGVQADEIAVSVPDIENYSAYLQREFYLRAIPFEFRSGFKLGGEQAGKVFSLIYTCVQNNFSFEYIKPLILNAHIPWKDSRGAELLIEYGIKNNCAVSWKDKDGDTEYKNIWIESFKINVEKDEQEIEKKERAKAWFYGFYYSVKKMCSSKTFFDLQKNYFLFREKCLNVESFSEKDNAILGRCISCLKELCLLEQDFFKYMPQDRFKFFTERLDEEIYVPQNTGCAVSIFPFRVAAATPFKYHFIVNCSQKDTTVIYSKLSFLRKDQRDGLGVFEINASPYFFSAYTESEYTVFSFSEHTFTDYVIANSIFTSSEKKEMENKIRAEEKNKTLKPLDSFFYEYNAVLNGKTDIENAFTSIYKLQNRALLSFADFKSSKDFSYLKDKYVNTCTELTDYILQTKYQDSNVKLSQTDLKIFYECGVKWFLSSLLSIRSEKYDAEIFNMRDIGNLTHKVLECLYKDIKETDGAFLKDHVEKYKTTASNEFDKIAKMTAEFKNALAAPFIEALKRRVLTAVDFVLHTDSQYFNGYSPDWVEEWIEVPKDGILYRGKLDRVSFSSGDKIGAIIDYKTNTMPAYGSYGTKTDEQVFELSDFQIPMYIFLAEEKLNHKMSEEKKVLKECIEHAWFLSFKERKVNTVVNNSERIPLKNAKSVRTRENFQKVIDAFVLYAKQFAFYVKEENFTKPFKVKFEDCIGCSFKNICRTVF